GSRGAGSGSTDGGGVDAREPADDDGGVEGSGVESELDGAPGEAAGVATEADGDSLALVFLLLLFLFAILGIAVGAMIWFRQRRVSDAGDQPAPPAYPLSQPGLGPDLETGYAGSADVDNPPQSVILDPLLPPELNAVRPESSSARAPGDVNQDGSVDTSDYAAWRKSVGTDSGSTVEDYLAWRETVGDTASTPAGGPASPSGVQAFDPAQPGLGSDLEIGYAGPEDVDDGGGVATPDAQAPVYGQGRSDQLVRDR